MKQTRRLRLGRAAASGRCTVPAIVSVLSADRGFGAVQAMVAWDGESDSVRLDAAGMSVLGVSAGDIVGFTPLTRRGKKESVPAGGALRGASRATPRKVAAGTPRRKG